MYSGAFSSNISCQFSTFDGRDPSLTAIACSRDIAMAMASAAPPLPPRCTSMNCTHAAPARCTSGGTPSGCPTLYLRASEPLRLCAAPRRHACRALALATTAHAPRPHVAGERDGHRDGLQWRERGARTCAAQHLTLVRRRACRRRPRSPPTAPHPGTVPALLIRKGGRRAGALYDTRYA